MILKKKNQVGDNSLQKKAEKREGKRSRFCVLKTRDRAAPSPIACEL